MQDDNDNGFLSDLANGLNFSLGWLRVIFSFYHTVQIFSISKFNPLIFVDLISFLHLFAELVHDGFVKPGQTAASTRNFAAAT